MTLIFSSFVRSLWKCVTDGQRSTHWAHCLFKYTVEQGGPEHRSSGLRDSLSNHQPTLPPMLSYYIPHMVYTICHKSKTDKRWIFPFSISTRILRVVLQLHPPPSNWELCIKGWWEDGEEAVVAPLTHSFAPLPLSGKTKNKVYPHNTHVCNPSTTSVHPHPPRETWGDELRWNTGDLLMGNEVCACVYINACVFVLLSSDPPPPQMKPPPTSGSSQPATTDHTCVPSATHAHTQNLTLIVGNVSAPLCCGQ